MPIALQWLLSPGQAASSLDLPLLSGAARSTQIGDMGAPSLRRAAAAGDEAISGVASSDATAFREPSGD